MSAVIAWTCKSCGHHAKGLSVEEYMAQDRDHVCAPADVIRRAVRYFRARAAAWLPNGAVADWLESCAEDIGSISVVAGTPDLVSLCEEPGSVRHALLVARATPWEEQ